MSQVYSHHIFIFPFKWQPHGDASFFSDEKALESLHKKLTDSPATQLSYNAGGKQNTLKWKRFQFNWKESYNEAVYFHTQVRDILFDQEGTPSKVLQYHVKPDARQELLYQIDISSTKYRPSQSFKLEIEELTLNFYHTGIGFLAFHLNNLTEFGQNDRDKVLLINDFGRRIFPQFLKDGHETTQTKEAFLADRIRVLFKEQVIVEDDFSRVGDRLTGNSANNTGFLVPEYVTQFLPKDCPAIEPLMDDRMFVICWVADKGWLEELGIQKYENVASAYLYSYIFIDGSIQSGIKNQAIIGRYLKEHTYTRWADDHLYYGMSRYSFVVLADSNDFHVEVIQNHVKTIYFQIALICLLQRGSIVRFSEEISRLSKVDIQQRRLGDHANAVKFLYQKYLQFVNQIYFREVTPQEQGIELYKMLQSHMDIPIEVKALETEIRDFTQLLELESDRRQADVMDLLSIIGAGLLIPSVILAFYGAGNFDDISNKRHFTQHWIPLITFLGSLVGILSAVAWVRTRESSADKRKLLAFLAIGSILVILYVASQAAAWWYTKY